MQTWLAMHDFDIHWKTGPFRANPQSPNIGVITGVWGGAAVTEERPQPNDKAIQQLKDDLEDKQATIDAMRRVLNSSRDRDLVLRNSQEKLEAEEKDVTLRATQE